MSTHIKTVHIYIDNSNLWIQGQKTYARKKGFDVSWDPTWRFDVGRLKAILTQKSIFGGNDIDLQVKINLYGSTPPPVDSIWEAFKTRNVKVTTFARSSWTEREKQVDSELGLDSALQASEDRHLGIDSEFVIVSGDRDLYSAVKKIMARDFPVHVWSWKDGLAGVYSQLPPEYDGLLQVHLLDDYLEQIGFHASTFRIERDAIPAHSTVVLDPSPKVDEINHYLGTLTFPTCRYVCPTKRANASSHDLVIIPAFARSTNHNDLERLHQLNKKKLEAFGLTVTTYFEYCQDFLKDSAENELALSNQFREGYLPEDDIATHATEEVDDHRGAEEQESFADHNEDYTTVDRSSTKTKKRFSKDLQTSQSPPCQYGRYCSRMLGCNYSHSVAQKDAFKLKGSAPKWKNGKMCSHGKECTRGRFCDFAHDQKELFVKSIWQFGFEMALVQKYKIKKRPRRESSDDYSVEEISLDDIGYDGDIEVLHPDQYEEPESDFEDDNGLRKLYPDTDEELASKLRRLSCERQPRNANGEDLVHGRKRLSTEMDAEEESPSLHRTEIEVSELVEGQAAQPPSKRRKQRPDKISLAHRVVKGHTQEAWADSSDITEDAAQESSNSPSTREATNTPSIRLKNGHDQGDADAMEIG